MKFSCLKCRELLKGLDLCQVALPVAPHTVDGPMENQLVSSSEKDTDQKIQMTPKKRTGRKRGKNQSLDEVITACTKCNGYFHLPCLEEKIPTIDGKRFVCQKCAPSEQDDQEEKLPLLVPSEALPYLHDQDDKDEVPTPLKNGWLVCRQEVEICTGCRQIDVKPEEKVLCIECSQVVLHKSCLEHFLPLPDLPTTPASSSNRRGGKKRKRSAKASIQHSCDVCISKQLNNFDFIHHGVVETQKIAFLGKKEHVDPRRKEAEVKWWMKCTECESKFCLHEFGPDFLQHDRLIQYPAPYKWQKEMASIWKCVHCAPPPPEVAMVIICDGCNAEYDMALLNPPMLEAPMGDWFCDTCKHHAPLRSPDQIVTAIVCDGCDGEYELPPETSIPDGEWFCVACTSKGKGQDNQRKRKNQMVKQEEDLVTILICDGCNGEYDAALLNPPLKKIPKGDWFCHDCSSQVQGSSRFTKRKVKAGRPRKLKLEDITDDLLPLATCSECQEVSIQMYKKASSSDVSVVCNKCEERAIEVEAAMEEGDGTRGRKRKRTGTPINNTTKRGGVTSKKSSVTVTEEISLPKGPVWVPQPFVLSLSTLSKAKASGRKDEDYDEDDDLPLDDDDVGMEAEEQDQEIILICDDCLSEIPMSKELPPHAEVPRRPWYCTPCTRKAKKSKKKKNRVSKQMLMEIQAHGGLLRTTSAKQLVNPSQFAFSHTRRIAAAAANVTPGFTIDIIEEPESNKGATMLSTKDRVLLYNLVGKRVLIFFKWDNQWVSGRVHALSPVTCLHLVIFEDETFDWLPLYAMATLIGTRSSVYIKLPRKKQGRFGNKASIEWWWPGQIMQMNSVAKKMLFRSPEDEENAKNFRLVCLYNSTKNDNIHGGLSGKSNLHVCYWVPKYLCRAVDKFTPPVAEEQANVEMEDQENRVGNTINDQSDVEALVAKRKRRIEFDIAVEKAANEFNVERTVIIKAFEDLRLRTTVERGFQTELVGEWLEVFQLDTNSWEEYLVIKYDNKAKQHELSTTDNKVVQVAQLGSDLEFKFRLKNPFNFALIASKCLSQDLGAENILKPDTVSKSTSAAGANSANKNAASSTPSGNKEAATAKSTDDSDMKEEEQAQLTVPQEKTCSKCLLSTEVIEDQDGEDLSEELVSCSCCAQFFHYSCADPVYGQYPLVNESTGETLIEDIRPPFVCGNCATCVGCGSTDKSVELHQWRLTLQPISICTSCLPYYHEGKFCTVCCNTVTKEELENISKGVAFLQCSTCDQFIHATCEPDENVNFHHNEFDLDVQVPQLENLIKSIAAKSSNESNPELSNNVNSSAAVEEPEDESSIPTTASTASTREEHTKLPARLQDEEFACHLEFKSSYDPRIFHQYECLTCRKIRMVKALERLRDEDKMQLFHEPVTEAIAPNYFQVIKNPMDLSTMQKKVFANAYKSTFFQEFEEDFELICLNAVTFNSKERDFLIWREAWRFYGQGGRILKQTIAKTQHNRGGKNRNAMIVAAKRQLPNNSTIGKKSLLTTNDGEPSADPGNDEGFLDFDMRDISNDTVAADSLMDEDGGEASGQGSGTTDATSSSAGTKDGVGSAATTATAIGSTSATQNTLATTCTSSVNTNTFDVWTFQKALCTPTGPLAQIQGLLMKQTRFAAYMSCWLDLCVSCGSGGSKQSMIFCVDCGEAYHMFCTGLHALENGDALIDEQDIASNKLRLAPQVQEFWRCENCKLCELCGQPGHRRSAASTRALTGSSRTGQDNMIKDSHGELNDDDDDDDEDGETKRLRSSSQLEDEEIDEKSKGLEVCGSCERGFHRSCLTPAPGNTDENAAVAAAMAAAKSNGKQKKNASVFFCGSCVNCSECGKKPTWNAFSFAIDLCYICWTKKQAEKMLLMSKQQELLGFWHRKAKRMKKLAEKCPICRQKWSEEQDLIQCDACEFWVHPTCDLMDEKNLKKLQTDRGNNLMYLCACCRSKERVHLKSFVGNNGAKTNGVTTLGHATKKGTWKLCVLLDEIQQMRSVCDGKWKEIQAQVRQVQQWKQWKEQMPLYLYIVRLGEECLKALAFKSLDSTFQTFASLPQDQINLPKWLVTRAYRYLRFKRYTRGPRASLRRLRRKESNFYSQQGMEQNEPHAICTMVSQATNCAAFLACCHLFYGWRALPKFALHLLNGSGEKMDYNAVEDGCLSADLVELLMTKNKMTLEEEMVHIKKQYKRLVAAKHGINTPTSVGSSRSSSPHLPSFPTAPMSAATTPTAASIATTTSDEISTQNQEIQEKQSNPGEEAKEASTSIEKTPAPTDNENMVQVDASVKKSVPPRLSITITPEQSSLVVASCDFRSSPSSAHDFPIAQITLASPLHAPPKADQIVEDEQGTAHADADERFCCFCFGLGDDSLCGRLLYCDVETWVHVNCAMWSNEVFENEAGILIKTGKARHRSRLNACDFCGLAGATIGCCVTRCQAHYHFPCAIQSGVVFLMNSETCCPDPNHIALIAAKHQGTTISNNNTDMVVDTVLPVVKEETDPKEQDEKTNEEDEMMVEVKEEPSSDTKMENENKSEDPNDVKQVQQMEERNRLLAKLPVVDPTHEPTRHLVCDLALSLEDSSNANHHAKKKKKIINKKSKPKPRSAFCFRVGALTVHFLGQIVVGNAFFCTRDHIFPLGFRSTRIFWSWKKEETRCLYECFITSTRMEKQVAKEKAKKLVKEKNQSVEEKDDDDDDEDDDEDVRPLFKITCFDDPENIILSSSPTEAVTEVRSRIVALYEEKQFFQQHALVSTTAATARTHLAAGTPQTPISPPSLTDQQLNHPHHQPTKNPFLNRSSWFSYGLLSSHFFGFGLPMIAKEIEQLPHAATSAISRSWIKQKRRLANINSKQDKSDMASMFTIQPVYQFMYVLPSEHKLQLAQAQVEQLVIAKERAMSASGSARGDGWTKHLLFAQLAKKPRRRLSKHATSYDPFDNEPTANTSTQKTVVNQNIGGTGSSAPPGGEEIILPLSSLAPPPLSTSSSSATGSTDNTTTTGSSSGTKVLDLEHLPLPMQYRELRRRPFDERLLVRKSAIHGYGLFVKEKIFEGQMIVEYQGQMIRQKVADEREQRYEEQGIGSCYMFRLDEKTIIDATRTGNLARFINHSCDPKAFARIITVDGNEKKIIIFAKKTLEVGEEVTYDYKFPIEDEAIRCDCNAPNCIGRMN